jgi:hypothetical protein
MDPTTTPAAAVPRPELDLDPAPALPGELDHDPPTPRTPMTAPVLAQAAQPERQGSKRGGLSLIVVLLLLIIVGSGVGYLLFKLFISAS